MPLMVIRAMELSMVAALLAGLACARGPRDLVCPDAGAGSLVVTEIRGQQGGFDTWGQWIEVFNATDHDVAVGGLELRLAVEDGAGGVTKEAGILVLDPDLVIRSRSYLVLGRFPEGDLPGHADFGYESQFGSSLFESGCTSSCESMLKDQGCPSQCRALCDTVCTGTDCTGACVAASGLAQCAGCAPLPCSDVCAGYEKVAIELLSCGVLVDRVEYFTLPGTGTWAFDGSVDPDASANDDSGLWCIDDFAPGESGAPGTPGERNRPCVE